MPPQHKHRPPPLRSHLVRVARQALQGTFPNLRPSRPLQPAGVGAWHYADGSWYKGPLVKGLQQGHGEFRAADGSSYVGSWLAGERSGHGEFRSAGASTPITGYTVYTGSWRNNLRHGFGRLVEREPGPMGGISEFEGEWLCGHRHGHVSRASVTDRYRHRPLPSPTVTVTDRYRHRPLPLPTVRYRYRTCPARESRVPHPPCALLSTRRVLHSSLFIPRR